MINQEQIKIEETSVLVPSGTVYYQVAGSGPPVVLLHGMAGSVRWWVRNIQPLAAYFRVYAVDMLGFGRGRGQRFDLYQSSRVILEWMDALHIDQFDLVAHSMGGFVAADLASHVPQRINRLVLVDPAAVPIGRSLVRNAVSLLEALRYMPLDFLPVLVTDSLRAGPVTLALAIRDILRADIQDDLSKIEADTLIIWGQYDTLLPLEMGERLRQALPLAEYVVIEGAGHNPMWDRPKEFNQVVLDFLLRGKD
jgi:pimeloyl-ACP methyl ester carboxylesterase